MPMSKKDYEAIAIALGRAWTMEAEVGLAAAEINIADVLAADNPRFDRKRFADAISAEARKGRSE